MLPVTIQNINVIRAYLDIKNICKTTTFSLHSKYIIFINTLKYIYNKNYYKDKNICQLKP